MQVVSPNQIGNQKWKKRRGRRRSFDGLLRWGTYLGLVCRLLNDRVFTVKEMHAVLPAVLRPCSHVNVDLECTIKLTIDLIYILVFRLIFFFVFKS